MVAVKLDLSHSGDSSLCFNGRKVYFGDLVISNEMKKCRDESIGDFYDEDSKDNSDGKGCGYGDFFKELSNRPS